MSENEWKLQPIPQAKTIVELDGQFSLEDYEKLKQGYLPQSADDKWILFTNKDDTVLHIHRAKTGICVFLLLLQPTADGCLAPKVAINRDPLQYTCTDDQYNVALMAYLIDRYLFGRDTTPPLPAKMNKQYQDKHQQEMLGTDELPPKTSGFIHIDDLFC